MRPQITLLLHNIRSTHNVGSIFRTAEGFGISQIIISGYTPYPSTNNDPRLPHISEKLTRQIHKTALGAERLVLFSYVDDISQFISQAAVPIVALEQSANSVGLADFQFPREFILLLGEEVDGISGELLEKADSIVEIPMFGQKESFNVSVACGIALFAANSTSQKPCLHQNN